MIHLKMNGHKGQHFLSTSNSSLKSFNIQHSSFKVRNIHEGHISSHDYIAYNQTECKLTLSP